MQSQHVTEILIEQRRRELERINVHTLEALAEMQHRDGLRRSVASALIRLGMILDREAGARAALVR